MDNAPTVSHGVGLINRNFGHARESGTEVGRGGVVHELRLTTSRLCKRASSNAIKDVIRQVYSWLERLQVGFV